jgi:isopenicillin N synthase-like dioxygenase
MTVPTPFHIPTIDITPYLASPTSPAAQKVVEAVREACTTTGFFQLIGHGISPDLQEKVFKGSAELFKLPMEEKIKLDRAHSVGASNRGYELIGEQGLQEGTLPDLKEVRTIPLLSQNRNPDFKRKYNYKTRTKRHDVKNSINK